MNEQKRIQIINLINKKLRKPTIQTNKQIQQITQHLKKNKTGIILITTINKTTGKAQIITIEIKADKRHIQETIELIKQRIPILYETIKEYIQQKENKLPKIMVR